MPKTAEKIVSYKRRNYLLRWIGVTKLGHYRAHLQWLDSEKTFWADGDLVTGDGIAPRTSEQVEAQERRAREIEAAKKAADKLPEPMVCKACGVRQKLCEGGYVNVMFTRESVCYRCKDGGGYPDEGDPRYEDGPMETECYDHYDDSPF